MGEGYLLLRFLGARVAGGDGDKQQRRGKALWTCYAGGGLVTHSLSVPGDSWSSAAFWGGMGSMQLYLPPGGWGGEEGT